MKHRVRTALLDRGAWLERASSDSDILALLSRLRPQATPLIRVGSRDADGGYLLPDDLEGISAMISPGVSDECSFDLDIAERGIPVFMADASVDGPPERHKLFNFSKKFLDTFSSPSTVTLNDFCKQAPEGDLLLQMDIESAEYRVLSSASEELVNRFRIMAIEFHWLDSLFTPFGLREIGAVFDRLLRTHNVVHIHPNNCRPPVGHAAVQIPCIMEFTFLRKDRTLGGGQVQLPHPLDRDNVQDLPGYPLPDCWWRN